MRYVLAGNTDRGYVREHNEDAVDWLNRNEWALAVVADGMGGYSGGEVASSLAVDLFVQEMVGKLTGLEAHSLAAQKAQGLLREAGEMVNRRIKEEQRAQSELSRMGTTLVAGLAWRNYISVIHAGDSRCYRWRDGQLARMTRDHTYVEEMVANGELGAGAAVDHPMKHMLTRALGGRHEFEFSVATYAVEAGDRYLFCSDGLSNCINSARLKRILALSDSPKMLVSSLMQTAKDLQADDNISAVVLCVSERE